MKYRTTGLTAAQAKHLADVVPVEQWGERLAQFRALKRYHFTGNEAMKAITAKTPTGALQSLDLKNDYWKQCINERRIWFMQQMKRAERQGLTPIQSKRAVNKMMTDWERDKKRQIHDWFKDVYKVRRMSDMTEEEFKVKLKARRERMARQKQPFRPAKVR